jgi:hypothetical protein
MAATMMKTATRAIIRALVIRDTGGSDGIWATGAERAGATVGATGSRGATLRAEILARREVFTRLAGLIRFERVFFFVVFFACTLSPQRDRWRG